MYNFTSLAAIQMTNFILPLLVIPYLLRTVGIEKYGLISFAQALMTYFVIITDYGFSLSATREIAIHKNDKNKITNIYSTVISVKLILCIICFFILTITMLTPKFGNDWLLYYSSFTLVFGQALFPIWLFQGLEQLKYVTYLNIISKIIFTALVFVYVQNPSDYLYVNILQGTGIIIASLISQWIIYKKLGIKFKVVKFKLISQQFTENWHLFLSTFSVNTYINSNLFILGLFTNAIIVGQYSIAEKVITAIRQLLVIFSQAIYPKVCQLTQNSHKKIIILYKNVFIPFAGFILICCLIIIFLADYITLLLTGNSLDSVSQMIKILGIVPFIVVLNIPANQLMLAYQFKRSYSIILIVGSFLNIVLNVILSHTFSMLGTAISVIFTEIFITIGLYLMLEFKHSKYGFFHIKYLLKR